MNVQTAKFNRPKVLVVALALSALAITLLAVVFASGPAQAQSPDNTPTPVPILDTYPDPQPCGLGAATASMEEPHEVTTGHFALFDAYWRTTVRNALDSAGVLHTNLCPPKVAQTTKTQDRETVTVTTRSASGIDIEEAILHVLDKHKATVVATNAEATAGQLSLQEYPYLRKGLGLGKDDPVPAGTQVWWLRLDDPDTTSADETSDLSLGFSTALLDDKYWLTSDDGKPMRYKFEVQRTPAATRHFFAYEAPKEKNAEAELVWDSFRADIDDDDMVLDPGEYRGLQWIFTEPGTYKLSVHLQGFVRKTNPLERDDLNYDANWRRISGNETETSEVKTYVIQVGSKLTEVEPPLFGANLSVAENSLGGVSVGDPITVYRSESKTMKYGLSGDGHANFKAVAVADPPHGAPHAVQIVVADGASLDYETKSSYDLTLSVSDGVDHENNADTSVDDTLAVRVALEDEPPGLTLVADRLLLLKVGETAHFSAVYEPRPEHLGETFTYVWSERIFEGDVEKWKVVGPSPSSSTWSVSQSSPVTKKYRVTVRMLVGDNPQPVFVNSNTAQVTWEN